MDNTLNDRENKVLNFIDSVNAEKKKQEDLNRIANSYDAKLRYMNSEQERGKDICLDMIFAKLYKDALPLNDDYKVAHAEDLDADMKDFMASQAPKGLLYYIKEQRKKNPIAKDLMEAVESVVKEKYKPIAFNLNNTDRKDITFKMDDDTQKKMEDISKNLELDDISDIIKNNVKTMAIDEIKKSKDQKEETKKLEEEMINDPTITTEADVEKYLDLNVRGRKKIFAPTLFEGMMIGNVTKLNNDLAMGTYEEPYLYGTMDLYRENTEDSDIVSSSLYDVAFVESVKDLTKESIMKALNFKKFDKYTTANLAMEYASK